MVIKLNRDTVYWDWKNSTNGCIYLACLCVNVAMQHDSCAISQKKAWLPSLLSYYSHGWASPIARQLFCSTLACLKSCQLHQCRVIHALQKWAGQAFYCSLFSLGVDKQVSGQIPEAHEIYLRWTPVWLATKSFIVGQPHRTQSNIDENSSSVARWWWVCRKGRNLSRC